ncbi:hypothetical protein FRB91_001847 [Serendipita sp. 411]|nr:hypothetical protein FRC18_006782 [Serendipita sp. 400]KAG8855733.1 hypothetical protein FRB91_001847 [Serendipita sp. 411]
MDDIDDTLTNLTKPLSSATITVRVIKSFEYRVAKALVLHDLDLTHTTVGELKEKVAGIVKMQAGWKPYRTMEFDTLKLYTKAHGAKTTNLIINLENDEWILDNDALLADTGLENEAEVSFFNRSDYDAFKASPEIKWD